jgi:hypothetical protein
MIIARVIRLSRRPDTILRFQIGRLTHVRARTREHRDP